MSCDAQKAATIRLYYCPSQPLALIYSGTILLAPWGKSPSVPLHYDGMLRNHSTDNTVDNLLAKEARHDVHDTNPLP
jgi:hypothetical protein